MISNIVAFVDEVFGLLSTGVDELWDALQDLLS